MNGGLKRRILAAAAIAGAALLIAASLSISLEPVGLIAVLFVLVVPFEKLMPRHRGQRLRRPQIGTDIAHGLIAPLLTPVTLVLAAAIGLASLAWLPGLALRPVVTALPPTVQLVAGVALFDFVIYWTHRFSHEIPFLWRFHAIHHSTETLDWVSGLRSHPFDGLILAPAFVLLLAAGFDPEYAGVVTVVQILTGIFLHANVRWRLAPLHRVIITPEFHHWHHTNEPVAIHSNYSVFLPLWDLVFGTYFMPSNRRPETYGVDEYIPRGVVGQLLWPLRGVGNPIRHLWRLLRHPVRSVRFLGRQVGALLGQMRRSAARPTSNITGVVPRPPTRPTAAPEPALGSPVG